MFRKIIRIDEEKCNGCGACARACHEGAIAMVDGKAKLMREDYCDGLGDCLPACPTGAISFEMREAPAYDEAAVLAAKKRQGGVPHVCPGAKTGFIRRDEETADGTVASSCLSQWPVQIKLAPINAPWFAGADLLVAADCTAFAYGNFHADFIRGRITPVSYTHLSGLVITDWETGAYFTATRLFSRANAACKSRFPRHEGEAALLAGFFRRLDKKKQENASDFLPSAAGRRLRALTKPANAKIALNKEKSGAIFASCVSCTCSLRSLTSM